MISLETMLGLPKNLNMTFSKINLKYFYKEPILFFFLYVQLFELNNCSEKNWNF